MKFFLTISIHCRRALGSATQTSSACTNERDDRFESVRKNCVEFVAVELDRVEAALEDSAGCVFISEWLVFPFRVTGAVEQSIALVECAKKGGGNLGVVGGYE